MIIIKTIQEESDIKKLLNMSNAGPNQIEFIKEMTLKYLGEAQVHVTCWTCPASIQNVFKRLSGHIRDYKLEIENDKANITTGQGTVDSDKEKKQKRIKPTGKTANH
jgi:hypothetical protein